MLLIEVFPWPLKYDYEFVSFYFIHSFSLESKCSANDHFVFLFTSKSREINNNQCPSQVIRKRKWLLKAFYSTCSLSFCTNCWHITNDILCQHSRNILNETVRHDELLLQIDWVAGKVLRTKVANLGCNGTHNSRT